MERKLQQAGWWSLIMAGLAGAAYLPYRSTPAALTERMGPAQGQLSTTESARDAQPSDALTLVGQYFGIDVSETGLKRRLLAAGLRLKPERENAPLNCPATQKPWVGELSSQSHQTCEDIDVLTVFFDLDIEPRTPGLERGRSAFRTLAACARDGDQKACSLAVNRKDRDVLRAFLRDYLDEEAMRVSNPPLEDRRRASDFSRLNRSSLAQVDVAHAARRDDTDLSFIVATVPDGVDSFAGWSFDPATDAIRRAAERSDYVMDRFFLPDWSNRGSGSALGRTHEEQPGAILFRAKPDPKSPRRSLLVVLLVLETPTTGVHAVAMDRALRLAGWWEGPGAYPELRILGPFYSGTTSSLQQSLGRVVPSLRVPEVRIISGSATTATNKGDLEDDKGYGAKVTFAATTLPDNRCELREQLQRHFGVTRMAWLTESNTVYGTSQTVPGTLPSAPSRSTECDALMVDVNFTFPLHISRLRDLSPAGPPDRQTVNTLLPLVLREAFTPSDAFPSLSPPLTSAGAEMMLRNIGRLISRERIHVVGITATDARDKLFLARAIRQMQPSVTFITTEANILYSHPDYSDSVRGMLVASSYPLTSFVPEMVPADAADARRVSFSSSAAEGIYNAALVQMSRQGAKGPDPTPGSGSRVSFFIYGRESIPVGQERRPSLWFSLVGREDTWPIRLSATSPMARDNPRVTYTFGAPNPSPKIAVGHAMQRVHPGVQLGYLSLSLIVVLHVVAFFSGRPRWMRRLASRPGYMPIHARTLTQTIATTFSDSPARPKHWMEPLRRKNQGGRYRRHLACFGSLMVLYATSVALQIVWARELGLLARVVTVCSAILLGLVAIICLTCVVRIAGTLPPPKDMTRFWLKRAAYSGVVLVVSAACTAAWGFYAFGLLGAGLTLPETGALVVERYARLSNGLSPVLPLVLLASVVYLWGFLDLSGHPVPIHRRFNDSLRLLNELTIRNTKAVETERAQLITARLFAVLIVLALGVWLTMVTPVFSFEGLPYGYTYTAATLLVHALVVSKLLVVWHRWGVFSGRLDQLEASEHWIVKVIAGKSPANSPDSLRLPEFNAALLFKGPRLTEVESLCRAYETAVSQAPRLLRDVIPAKEAAHLDKLENFRERWIANPPIDPALAPAFNPLQLFALLDRHAFDDLFRATLNAVRAQPVDLAAVAGQGGVRTAAAGATAVAADDFVRATPAISTAWRRALGHRLPEGIDAARAMWWVAMQPDAADLRRAVARISVLPLHIQKQLEYDKHIEPNMPGAISRAWEVLTGIAVAAGQGESSSSWASVSGESGSKPDQAGQDTIARFLALYLFSSVRMALWRIWRPLGFIMAAILLVTLSHLVYPIQPRGLLVGVAAAEVMIGATLAVRALLATERNAILSRLTGGREQQIDWSWQFAGRLAAWVALPIVGVVATRFPDIGDFVLRLFSPLEALTR